MKLYILRRLAQTLLMLVCISFISFTMMALMPGDPVEEMLMSNPTMTTADVARLKEMYGLNLPIHERYVNWLADVVQGNLGYSRAYKVPVTELMGERILNTFTLSILSLMISVSVAIPLGIVCALKRGSAFDNVINMCAFAGQSMPAFWIGIIAIMIVSVNLGLLPAGGTQSIGANLSGLDYVMDKGKYLILPVLVFAFAQVAVFVRYTRGAMLDVLKQDYMRTAKAKGLSRQRAIFVHALRNAAIPIVTMLALGLGGVFGGALITEHVFAYQGVGKLVYEAVLGNDFNVAMVGFNLTIAMVLLMNLVADVSYGYLDPRISYK